MSLLLVLLFQAALLFLFYEVAGGGNAVVGPFAIGNYLVPILVFGLPPVVVFGGLSFGRGSVDATAYGGIRDSRHPRILLPFFLTWSPPWLSRLADQVLMVADPSGLRWLNQTVLEAGLDVAHVNSQPVGFDGLFWLNRILLVGGTLLAVAASVPRARAFIAGDRRRRSESNPVAVPTGGAPASAALDMSQRTPGFIASTVQIARAELRELFSQPALYLMLPLLVWLTLGEGTSQFGPFGEPLIRTAGSISVAMFGILTFAICSILMFLRSKRLIESVPLGSDRILFALPFRTGALLLAKHLANAALVTVLLCVVVACLLPLLAFQPESRVAVTPFLLVWGLIMAPTYLLWNAFILALWSGLRERYTTYAVGFSALIVSLRLLQHPSTNWLTNWTTVGTLQWSDIAGLALDGRAILLNRVLVLSLAVLLTALALRLFARTERDGLRTLDRLRPRRLGRLAASLAPFAVLPLLVGAVLGYEVRTGFQGGRAADEGRAYWIRNVETWRGYVPPATRHVDLRVELVPGARTARVEGTYHMHNATEVLSHSLAFTVRPALHDVSWSLNGAAVSHDDRSGLHVLPLANPLAPGDSVRVGFSYDAVIPRGMTRNGGGTGQFVLEDGVLLHNLRNSFLPQPGFASEIGIDRRNRARPAEVPADFWRTPQRRPSGGEPYTTRIEVTVPSDYTVTSVGTKVRETTGQPAEGSTTTVWESRYGIGSINIVAGRLQALREENTAVFHSRRIKPTRVSSWTPSWQLEKGFSEWFLPVSLAGPQSERVCGVVDQRHRVPHQHRLLRESRIPEPARGRAPDRVRGDCARSGPPVVGQLAGCGPGPGHGAPRGGHGHLRLRFARGGAPGR